MKRYTFDVPAWATVIVDAETEQAAKEQATAYLEALQPTLNVDDDQSPSFSMGRDTDSPIELLDEEDIP